MKARTPLRGAGGRLVRGLLWLLLALAALVALYMTAALIGTLAPANAGWREPEEGVRIYVEDNGVHTGIVVPVAAAGVDWRGVVRPEHFADPRYAASEWLAFGWGNRNFYLNTPRWADLRPDTLWSALFGGGPTVLHVEHIAQPTRSANVRSVVLRPDEYRRLASFLRASFNEVPARDPGYGGWDVFYRARGHYGPFRTCNAWTGEALRHAGIHMGVWTPLSASVMFRLERE